MTRAESKEAFNHVLDTVLDRGDSSSLKRSLNEDVTRNHYHSKQSTNNGRNNGSGTRIDNPEQTTREKTIYFPEQQR
jgi:hypothetical protein